jgi:hypothetical protein
MPAKATSILVVLIACCTNVFSGVRNPGVEGFTPNDIKLQLIETATASWKIVNRWQIEYEAVPSSGDLFPVHKMMAVAAPGEYRHFVAHFPSGVNPWQWDPFWQETRIHQGRITHAWPFNRSYSEDLIKPGDDMPSTAWKDVLLGVLPNWPITDYKMPSDGEFGTPAIFIEGLLSEDCHLLVNSELMCGENCAVFDNKGIERLWVATNKGLCLIRQDRRDPHSHRLLVRILTDKVGQIAPNLWLPTEYRFQFFEKRQGTEEDTLVRENRVHILHCDINDKVPDATFIPEHRPGSIEYDRDQNFAQVSPGGLDVLSDAVTFMRKYAHLPSEPITSGHSWRWPFSGLAVGMLIGMTIRLRRRGVPMSKPSGNFAPFQ